MKQIMRKHLIFGVAIAAVTLMFTACGGSTRMTKATSSRLDFAKSVRCLPSLASLEVNPTRVSATAFANELESLNKEEQRQAVVAKALATVNADVLLAPQFSTAKGEDGKLASISVIGYAATIKSFRPMKVADLYVQEEKEQKSKSIMEREAVSTMTVAEMEYSAKKSISLTPEELAGKNEASALKLAKEKMLRQEKMDVLYGEQHSLTMENGILTSFTLTAFPGKYATYRKATADELKYLEVSKEPAVFFRTIAADIQTVAPRCQLKFGTGGAQISQDQLKETARAEALKKYNAEFLLNETFYFDYQDKVITNVTICGTPAVYANFHELKKGEPIDTKVSAYGADDEDEEGKPKSLLDTIMGLFKKKK